MAEQKKPATYADYAAVPETKAAEIIGGELYVFPRPASPQVHATSELIYELVGPFMRGRGGLGGWWIFFGPELHFGGDILVPDIAGWRYERMPEIPDAPHFELAPDWLCETLSQSSAKIDLSLKLPLYAQVGVKNVWLVDPEKLTVETFRCEAGRCSPLQVFSDSDRIRAEPFAEVEIDLSVLWAGLESP
jgi:Uma2 family endonuclease